MTALLAIGPDAPGVYARRAGRVAFGAVLIAGAALFVYRAVAFENHGEHPLRLWQILAGTWAAAFAVAGLVRDHARGIQRDSLRVASLAVPAVGMALLLPLTLQMPFALAIGGVRGFDGWCFVSLCITGHVHIIFALLVLARACRLAAGGRALSVREIYLWTMVAATIPFGVLLGIPPLLVGLTGIPIAPLLVHMEKIARDDREACIAVPFAIARAA